MVAKESAMDIKYDGKDVANSIAMVITLVSFTMLFAVFFLGYAIFRLNAQEWPPMGMNKVGLGIPSLSTLIIILSIVYTCCIALFLNYYMFVICFIGMFYLSIRYLYIFVCIL